MTTIQQRDKEIELLKEALRQEIADRKFYQDSWRILKIKYEALEARLLWMWEVRGN